MLSIDMLANHDITKWNEVLTQSYDRIMVKLVMNRERQEYQRRYQEVIKANNQ